MPYLNRFRLIVPYLGLIIVFLLACAFSPIRDNWPVFLDIDNLLDIVSYTSVRGILAVGMTFVIISGGIDLSVGSVLAVSTIVCALSLRAWDIDPAASMSVAILFALFSGALGGFFNGIFTALGRIQPFVVTLAMMSIARGVAMALSKNYTIKIPESQSTFLQLSDNIFGFIPVPALLFILAVIFFQILLVYTSYGRNIYAIGGNETAARLAGVRVDRLKIITYVICGALAAAAGILQTAKMHQGDPKEGFAYELDAIAMVVVGGANLMGGKGDVKGTLVGALLIGMIVNILGLRNVEPSVQKIVIGALLVFAVAIQTGTFVRLGRSIMKRISGLRTIITLAMAVILIGGISGCSSDSDAKYIIGFSQCNNNEPWRQAMNDAARREAANHPEIELRFQDAEQRNDMQVNQVKLLMRQGIDLLIISPNEAAPLTPIVEEVYNGGTPVIVLDRGINSDAYTCFIGADNREIGRKAGEFIADTLNGKGKVVEIKGLPGSPPAIDRSEGFREVIKKYPEITIIHDPVANWLRSEAVDQMKRVLQAQPEIDLVYGHNDPMALGAFLAADQVGRADEIKFVGIDALADETGGIQAVINGQLDATFWYPTCGQEAIENAVKILNGENVEKNIRLPTALITKENAQEWLDKLGGSDQS